MSKRHHINFHLQLFKKNRWKKIIVGVGGSGIDRTPQGPRSVERAILKCIFSHKAAGSMNAPVST